MAKKFIPLLNKQHIERVTLKKDNMLPHSLWIWLEAFKTATMHDHRSSNCKTVTHQINCLATDSKSSEKFEGLSAHSRLFVEIMSFLSVQIFAPRAHV